MTKPLVLVLPGWPASALDPWPLAWASQPGYLCVSQHDWQRPLRGDWLIRLEEAVLAAPQVVVVAHDLGCIQLAAWAAHSRYTERVRAALLVAPLDVESQEMRERLSTWSPISRQRLPFKSGVIAAAYSPVDASQPAQAAGSQALAACWGAQWMGILAPLTPADRQSAAWPQGQALLHELLKD